MKKVILNAIELIIVFTLVFVIVLNLGFGSGVNSYAAETESNATGFIKQGDTWIFIRNGEVDTGYTGLAKQVNTEKTLRFVRNGVSEKYTGIYKYNNAYYAVRSGVVDYNFTGVVQNTVTGNWHFTRKGVYDTSYTGLARQVNSETLRYVKNGKSDSSYTGVHKYNNVYYAVIKGKVDRSFTGVIANEKGVLNFMRKGVWDKEYVGLAKRYNSNEILYVKNGKWDNTYNGIYKYNGVFYKVTKGKVDKSFTGVERNESGVLHYIYQGIYDSEITGIKYCTIDGKAAYYYISKGKPNLNFTGLAKVGNDYLYIVKGEYKESYTGPFQKASDKKYYHIVNGKWKKTSGTYHYDIHDSGKSYKYENGMIVNSILEMNGRSIGVGADSVGHEYSNSKLISGYTQAKYYESRGGTAIKKITIHHMSGVMTAEGCGSWFAQIPYRASSHYGIGNDGKIWQYVDEKHRARASYNDDNDLQAITIEVSNSYAGGNWPVSDRSLELLIDLCTDICRRNGIERLNFTGDATGNLTMHKYFMATDCPGPYLSSKFPYIANEVNKRLEADD